MLLSLMITHADRVLRPPDDLLRDVLKHYDEGGAYQDCLVRTPETMLSSLGSPFTVFAWHFCFCCHILCMISSGVVLLPLLCAIVQVLMSTADAQLKYRIYSNIRTFP